MLHRSLLFVLVLATPSLACSDSQVEGEATSETSSDTGTAAEADSGSESVADSDSESGDGDAEADSGDGDTGDGDSDTGDGDAESGDGDAESGDGDADTGDGDGDGDTGTSGGPGDDCDLFAQDCATGLSCYPTELGGECLSTGTAGSSTMNLEQCQENNDCIEGLFCNPENFNHCVPFCELGTNCANGEPCNMSGNPDFDSLPEGVGYCYPWP